MQSTTATSEPGDLPETYQQTSAENRKMHDYRSFLIVRTFSSVSIAWAGRRTAAEDVRSVL
jgi:hypothetical protein